MLCKEALYRPSWPVTLLAPRIPSVQIQNTVHRLPRNYPIVSYTLCFYKGLSVFFYTFEKLLLHYIPTFHLVTRDFCLVFACIECIQYKIECCQENGPLSMFCYTTTNFLTKHAPCLFFAMDSPHHLRRLCPDIPSKQKSAEAQFEFLHFIPISKFTFMRHARIALSFSLTSSFRNAFSYFLFRPSITILSHKEKPPFMIISK